MCCVCFDILVRCKFLSTINLISETENTPSLSSLNSFNIPRTPAHVFEPWVSVDYLLIAIIS